jgi:hypothetical protein
MVSQECQGEFLREIMVENLNTIFPNMNGFLKDKNFKWCPTVWEFRTILLLYCIAEMACKRKHSKYSSIISSNYVFKGLAFETLGPWCKEAIDFINVIGNRLIAGSGDSKSKKFLFERISLAIQRGNAASIRGTFPDSAILSEIFVL